MFVYIQFYVGQRGKIKESLLQAAITFLNTVIWLAKSMIPKKRQIRPFSLDEV